MNKLYKLPTLFLITFFAFATLEFVTDNNVDQNDFSRIIIICCIFSLAIFMFDYYMKRTYHRADTKINQIYQIPLNNWVDFKTKNSIVIFNNIIQFKFNKDTGAWIANSSLNFFSFKSKIFIYIITEKDNTIFLRIQSINNNPFQFFDFGYNDYLISKVSSSLGAL